MRTARGAPRAGCGQTSRGAKETIKGINGIGCKMEAKVPFEKQIDAPLPSHAGSSS